MAGNSIGAEGGVAIAEALKTNQTVGAIDLGRKHVGREKQEKQGRAREGMLLCAHTHIESHSG